MRYTTIIDITENRLIYRNVTARLIYLHLVLKSGYHNEDRDLAEISIRHLSAEVGVTVSACRHALRQLEAAKLLLREGQTWRVTKYVVTEEITSRPKSQKQAKETAAAREREAKDRQREEERERDRREIQDSGKTGFMIYYEARLKAAAAGDIESQKFCEKNRAVYEEHKRQNQTAKK